MQFLYRTSPLFLALALASCGGSTPPPNDASSENKNASEAGSGSADSPEIAEERKGFMQECMETPEYESFCSCSWESITKTTTADERKDLENPNTKKALAALPEACGSKLPKAAMKATFMKTCTKNPAMGPFCECSYHFLDGKGLLSSGAEGVASVETEMKAACSKELYELSRAAFIHGCSSKQTESVCQCAFGALEKKYGKDKLQAFLESGTEDVKKAVRAAGATCGAK